MAAIHSGGCQCGKVRYRVEMEIGEVFACNCSRCQRLGSLLAFAPAEKFDLLSGSEDLATFEFNKHVIAHKFCRNCGIQPFAMGITPKTGAMMAAVNVRTIDGIEIPSLVIKSIDGKSF